MNTQNKLVQVTKEVPLSWRDQLKKDLKGFRSSSSGINAVLEDVANSLGVVYDFHGIEHDEWVHPTCFISCGGAKSSSQKNFLRPLSSWVLKNPFMRIPPEGDLERIAEWHRLLLFRESGKKVTTPKPLDVRDIYINNALNQLELFKIMLSVWKQAGHPTEQRECHPFVKKDVARTLSVQERNVSEALLTLKKVVNLLAPESLRESYELFTREEEEICAHLRKVFKYLKK